MSKKSLVKTNSEDVESKEEVWTLDPSYTRLLEEDYSIVCRNRINATNRLHRKQFQSAICQIGSTQGRAFHYVRVRRIFSNPILKSVDPSELITLTPSEERRLKKLLH